MMNTVSDVATPPVTAPALQYAFSIHVNLSPPVEAGTIDAGRRRFIPITGGRVTGPLLSGTVEAGGGDWQTILGDGLTLIEARYFLRAEDGTLIEITNPGVRTASVDVADRLARGEDVDPSLYYFRTSPRFNVAPGQHEWLRRKAFVGRGLRRPDHVSIDCFVID